MVVQLRGSLQTCRSWDSPQRIRRMNLNQSPDEKRFYVVIAILLFVTLQGTITYPIPAGTFESMNFRTFPRVGYVIVPWMFFQLIEVVKGPRDPISFWEFLMEPKYLAFWRWLKKKNTIWKKCFCWLTKLFFFGVLEFDCAFFFDSGVLWPVFQRLRAGLHPQLLGWFFEVAGVTMWDPAIVRSDITVIHGLKSNGYLWI